jgi:hypothetical protein
MKLAFFKSSCELSVALRKLRWEDCLSAFIQGQAGKIPSRKKEEEKKKEKKKKTHVEFFSLQT